MSYMDAFIELFTNTESPFSCIETSNVFNSISLLSTILKYIWLLIGRGLAFLLSETESFANECYNFLSFSNNEVVRELTDLLANYFWIPLVICLIIIAVKLMIGDNNNGKQFVKNLVAVAVLTTIMPSVISGVNNNIFGEDFLNTIDPNGASTAAEDVLRENTYDYIYLYNNTESLKEAFNDSDKSPTSKDGDVDIEAIIEDINETQKEFKDSDAAKDVSFNVLFDPTISIDKKYSDNIPVIFCYEVGKRSDDTGTDGNNSSKYNVKEIDFGGIFGSGFGATTYQRYKIDFLIVYIELIAQALMYFAVGYSVLKIIVELIYHQIFGSFVAFMDLSGGEKIKQIFNSILGCYVSLFISSLVFILYRAARTEVHNMLPNNKFLAALICVVLAVLFLDGPNLIAKYFGVQTGVKSGLVMGGAMAMQAVRTAKSAGRIATAPARGAIRFGTNIGQNVASQKIRDKVSAPAKMQEETERRREQVRRDNQNAAERNNQSEFKFNQDKNKFATQHGSYGEYEKYQSPMNYNQDAVGSEYNKNALTQQAAMGEISNDAKGKETNPDIAKKGALASANNVSTEDARNFQNVSKADIKDAKHGVYTGISRRAEQLGGQKQDYLREAEKFVDSNKNFAPVGDSREAYIDYVADASLNTMHSGEIRTAAQNLRATDTSRKTDVEYYSQAMAQSGFEFSQANIERIAVAEIRDNGSLSAGNIYDKRPVEPYKIPYKQEPPITRNTQTRGLQ